MGAQEVAEPCSYKELALAAAAASATPDALLAELGEKSMPLARRQVAE